MSIPRATKYAFTEIGVGLREGADENSRKARGLALDLIIRTTNNLSNIRYGDVGSIVIPFLETFDGDWEWERDSR